MGEKDYVQKDACEEVKRTVFKRFDEIKGDNTRLWQKLEGFESRVIDRINDRNNKDAYDKGWREGKIDALQTSRTKRTMSKKEIAAIVGAITGGIIVVLRAAAQLW